MGSSGRHFMEFIDTLSQEMLTQIDGLPDEALNWQPPLPDTNSMFVIAYHAAGATDQWVNGYVGQQTIERDRAAEFRASGDLSTLRQRLDRTLAACRKTLESLPESELETFRQVPAQYGDNGKWTVRESLLHAIEHLAVHVGHIQLTRQLWEAQAKQ